MERNFEDESSDREGNDANCTKDVGAVKSYWYPTAFSIWGGEEREALQKVIASGRFTMGEQVEAFEAEFAAYHGMKHAIMVNSGSSANLIAIAALCNLSDKPPLKRSHRVAVPGLAWPTTYAPLIQHGLELVLLDCDDTWAAPVPKKLVDVQLFVACSILGNPGYLSEFKKEAGRRYAYLIEDNCESLGAVAVDGKKCGTHGIMNTFSFFYSHQISGIEGGMILTDDAECNRLCRMLRNHGWHRDSNVDFENEYDFRLFGYNVRPLEMHAAVAREQLKKLDKFREMRMANIRLFRTMTWDLPIKHQVLVGSPDSFGLPFTAASPDTRNRLALALRAEGIDCRPPTGGSFRLHRYGRKWMNQKTPNCDYIHKNGLFLGNGPLDLSPQITKAVEVMRRVL